ncbi:MAG: glycosyltransferase family 1 protein [Leifsonia xyli]|nr:MAG: glycosyltransferase family 1 protein [Leifsonia xyli]
MTLYVDTSRIGMHGIGRYSREVVSRLDLEWTDLGHRLRRPLPVDALNPKRMSLSKNDVVYAPGFNAGITRATQLLTIHDLIHLQVPSEGSALKSLYYDRIVKTAIKKAGRVMTVSETSLGHITEWLNDESVQVVNTGNGVSDAFVPDGPVWSGMADYFVYVGNLREHKNVDVILRALVISPDLRLVMVTSDTALARQQISTLGIQGQVRVLSGVSDPNLASVYRGARALVMPSTIEGFGLPAAEAVATGTRVVYYAACESVSEIVGNQGVGLQTSSDAREWAAAMLSMPVEKVIPWRSFEWAHVAATVQNAIAAHEVGQAGR